MMRLTLAFIVAQASALALQPVHAAARSAAAVRSAAAMMADPEATRDSAPNLDSGSDMMATGETREELMARLRQPIRQFDGGWADTATRYGGKKKTTNINGEEIDMSATHYGTGGGKRLDTDVGSLGTQEETLPPEKQAMLVLPEESFKIEKMEMSQTDEDLVIECNLEAGELKGETFIDIEPMFLTKEEYFYGFTADSSPKISIDHSMSSDIEGEMNAKDHNAKVGAATMGSMKGTSGGRRIMIKLAFNPEFEVGEFDAYLCFIFPNEKAFSKFYKITGKSTN